MPEVRVVQHQGKPVVVIDVSGARADQGQELVDVFARAKQIIIGSPQKSVRALTNVTDCHFSKPVVDGLTDLARHATPHLIASAGVGVTGLKMVVAQGLFSVIGRKVELFASEQEAFDWLVRQ